MLVFPSEILDDGSHKSALGGVLQDEVPKIPRDSTIVTLYCGTNDITLADQRKTGETPSQAIERFASSLKAIVAGIRAAAPNAIILVATVPNRAVPRTAGGKFYSSKLPRTYENLREFEIVRGYKAAIMATGLPVVDLLCEPAMYDIANFSGLDVHPNERGQAIIAQFFWRELHHRSRIKACNYEFGPGEYHTATKSWRTGSL